MVSLIPLIGEKFIFEIMKSLAKGPKRYNELKKACLNTRTRTIKISKLKDAGLVKAEIGEERKRSVVRYRLTKKGEDVLEQLRRLEDQD